MPPRLVVVARNATTVKSRYSSKMSAAIVAVLVSRKLQNAYRDTRGSSWCRSSQARMKMISSNSWTRKRATLIQTMRSRLMSGASTVLEIDDIGLRFVA